MRREKTWTEPQTLLALAAVLISLVALWFSWESARSGRISAEVSRSEAARGAVLEVVSAGAHLGDDLNGQTVPLGGGKPRKLSGLTGPKIDIMVRNQGSGEGHIASATVEVLRSEALGCVPVGGHEGIAADYDVRVDPYRLPPFDLTLKLPLTVPPGEHERFALTLGPATDGVDLGVWAAVVRVSLRDSGGAALDVGTFAVVTAGHGDAFALRDGRWTIKPPRDLSCLRSNAQVVSDLRDLAEPSSEFESLHEALKPYAPA